MSRLNRTARVAIATMITACGASFAIAASTAPEDVIKARQQSLKDLGAAAKVVRDQLKESTPDVEKIKAASVDIKKASNGIGHWFPQGTGAEAGVKTAAKPEIWTDHEGFSTAAKNFVEQADKFAQTAQAGDVAAIGPAFKALGQSCGGCHEKFRVKQD